MKLLKFPLRFLTPKSLHEDVRRREFILTVFVASITVLIFISIGVSGINYLFFSDPAQRAGDALSFQSLFGIFAFFVSVWLLARGGLIYTGSYLLIGALFLLATYLGYRWGMDMPATILFYVLTITMAGVLISTRFAFLATFAISFVVGVMSYLHREELIEIHRYWATQVWKTTDVVVAAILFFILATVSWLSNREIERSLIRARRSEAELKEERDTLEVRVQERTRELRAAEMEKIAQNYRFIEFGRLASGLFHDLLNPLTALSLNIERIAQSGEQGKGVGTLAEDVGRAKRTTMHMRELLDAMRAHLSHGETLARFPLRDRIADVVRVLDPYARMCQVKLSFAPDTDIILYGDPTRFVQIMSNLISNAIETYPPRETAALGSARREVCVELGKKGNAAHIVVRDFGPGIAEEVRDTLFEPFVTTKKTRGLGLGLSLTKRMVEQDFGGTIIVESKKDDTRFVVSFPLRDAS